METKKAKTKNLENKRILFFQIGLIIALSTALIAFEWSSKNDSSAIQIKNLEDKPEDDMIEITRNEPQKTEPPKPVITEIEIISNEDPVVDENLFFNSELKENDDYKIGFWADTPEEKPDPNEIFTKVEDPPKFNGSEDLNEFWKYVQQHVSYPEKARELGLEGRILVNFVVDEKGDIINIELLRKIDPLLDQEVIKVLEESPLWTPGKQRNRPVKVRFTIPVIFKISKD
jgi:protein TonB